MIKIIKLLIFVLLCLLLMLPVIADQPDDIVYASSELPDPLRLSIFPDGQLLAEVDESPSPDLVSGTVSDTENKPRYSPRYAMIESIADESLIAWGTQLRWTNTDGQSRLRGSPFFSFRPSDQVEQSSQRIDQSINDAGADPYAFGDGQWHSGSIEQPEMNDESGVWQVSWQWPDDQLELVQTVSYQPGQWYFTICWQLINQGTDVLTNLDLIHGGDSQICSGTTPSTSEAVSASWDDERGRLILWPSHAWDCGMMILSGACPDQSAGIDQPSDQRPDHYLSLAASRLQSAVRDPRVVSDTILSQACDQAVLLQWMRDELAPGDCWTVSCCQRFTPAGQIHLIGPEPQSADPGEPVVMDCELLYRGQTSVLPDFSVFLQSQTGWPWKIEMADADCLLDDPAPGFSQFIHLSTVVPDTAVVGAFETFSVQVSPMDNPYLFSSAIGAVRVSGTIDPPVITPSPTASPSPVPSAIPDPAPSSDETDLDEEKPESTISQPAAIATTHKNEAVSDTTSSESTSLDTTPEVEEQITVTTDHSELTMTQPTVSNPTTGKMGPEQKDHFAVCLMTVAAVFTVLLGFYLIYARLIKNK